MCSAHENIVEVPQVPISMRFPTRAELQRLFFRIIGGGNSVIAKTMPRLPFHQCKPDSGSDCYESITRYVLHYRG